jgi:hypothetical protein
MAEVLSSKVKPKRKAADRFGRLLRWICDPTLINIRIFNPQNDKKPFIPLMLAD